MCWPYLVLPFARSSWSPHAHGMSIRRQPARILHELLRQSAEETIYKKALRADRPTTATKIVHRFFHPPFPPSSRDSPDADHSFIFYQCAVTDLGSQFSCRNTKSSTCVQKREKSSSTSPSSWNSRLRSRFVVCIHDNHFYHPRI